jgi:hypothetical protein
MHLKFKKLCKSLASLSLAFVLLASSLLSAFADTLLPEGAVAGLPEKLTITDNDGCAANSDTGAYYFVVDDMSMNEVYTKNISIMNLREDKAYHIYFYAEPISSSGEIELEEECDATFTYAGSTIYKGKVTGEGTPNLSEEPIDLGIFYPGQNRTLNCSIIWNGTSAGYDIDFGKRVIDSNGTTIVREPSGQTYIQGEVKFRWVFIAVLDEEYIPPKTGLFSSYKAIYIACIIAVALLILIMLLLILGKKKKRNKANETM